MLLPQPASNPLNSWYFMRCFSQRHRPSLQNLEPGGKRSNLGNNSPTDCSMDAEWGLDIAASLCMKAPQAIAAPVTPTKMSACLAKCHCTAGWSRSKWATSTRTRTSLKRGCSHPGKWATATDLLCRTPSDKVVYSTVLKCVESWNDILHTCAYHVCTVHICLYTINCRPRVCLLVFLVTYMVKHPVLAANSGFHPCWQSICSHALVFAPKGRGCFEWKPGFQRP